MSPQKLDFNQNHLRNTASRMSTVVGDCLPFPVPVLTAESLVVYSQNRPSIQPSVLAAPNPGFGGTGPPN